MANRNQNHSLTCLQTTMSHFPLPAEPCVPFVNFSLSWPFLLLFVFLLYVYLRLMLPNQITDRRGGRHGGHQSRMIHYPKSHLVLPANLALPHVMKCHAFCPWMDQSGLANISTKLEWLHCSENSLNILISKEFLRWKSDLVVDMISVSCRCSISLL